MKFIYSISCTCAHNQRVTQQLKPIELTRRVNRIHRRHNRSGLVAGQANCRKLDGVGQADCDGVAEAEPEGRLQSDGERSTLIAQLTISDRAIGDAVDLETRIN